METSMITCVIDYDIDPFGQEAFRDYARQWGQIIPRCGADLVGYFAPKEGSLTRGLGIYHLPSLAAYEAYRARLREDEAAQAAFGFAKEHGFIRREDRMFLELASAPHAPFVAP